MNDEITAREITAREMQEMLESISNKNLMEFTG